MLEGLIELRKISTKWKIENVLSKLIAGKTFTIKALHLFGEMEIGLNPNMNNNDLIYEQEWQYHQP